MRVLGVNGGFDPPYPTQDPSADFRMVDVGLYVNHDAAAVLVQDGHVVAAIEEERLNRLKHSNRVAMHAVQYCLRATGLSPADVDCVAYHAKEDLIDRLVSAYMLHVPEVKLLWTAREMLADVFSRHAGVEFAPEKFAFVEHHVAHAVSVFAMGPFKDALVVTLDGQGDRVAGTVSSGISGRLTRLTDLAEPDSLGHLYLEGTRYLGYRFHDEYKVMGLAPYGDPARFRPLFEEICVLGPDGQFTIDRSKVRRLAEWVPPRRETEPITTDHKDIAAALQETIERAALHYLAHYRQQTGHRHLCLAGGVAHNSSLVGKILRSRLFDGVFVQPASHDAGTALGAALAIHQAAEPKTPIAPLKHVYWGPDVGSSDDLLTRLWRWAPVVDIATASNPSRVAADLLARGEVIGWVQGRSEFGPRALGNRSILADPRPASNKDRINELVKHREGYRPFAPSVLEEHADRIFEIPPGSHPGFMTFVVPVRPEYRSALGAITHVDGTARVQAVSRETNPRFWSLIETFRQQTGIPVVLNTSFNHNCEPIVDSPDDAVTCLLTTGLTHLVIGDYLVTKKTFAPSCLMRMCPRIPAHVRVIRSREVDRTGCALNICRCENLYERRHSRMITDAAHHALSSADGERSLCELVDEDGYGEEGLSVLVDELIALWRERLIQFQPSTR